MLKCLLLIHIGETYMKSGIYLIKNIINNKVYIGSAVNIDKRWKEHKTLLKEGKHHSCHLQSAWDLYGEQSFAFELIEEVSNPQDLLEHEQVYLDHYKSYEGDRGYNICKVAGSPLGVKRSEETRKKLSEANKNRSEETRKKINEANKRRIISEETRKKISEANKGKIVSEETRKKLREANAGKKHSEQTKQKLREARQNLSEETRKKLSEAAKNRNEETRKNMSEAQKGKVPWNKGKETPDHIKVRMSERKEKYKKKIERICPETGIVVEYKSLKDAERDGYHRYHIVECCNGIAKKHKGYFWKYSERTQCPKMPNKK